MKTALVLGAGGFIGSHMVTRLKSEGYWVRGVDLKRPEFSESDADEFLLYDLRKHDNVKAVMLLTKDRKFHFNRPPFELENKPFDEIYQFAADMGGARYVFSKEHDADIMSNSAQININVLKCATTEKIFYSSSACIYPQGKQDDPNHLGLRETDAWPADPDSDYGVEKLFSERLYLAYAKNKNTDVRIGRFHNIYGSSGTYKGGREKAPAALCRKVAEAKENIEVWGTGGQTRSFLYIDDCIEAVRLLMESEFSEPINIGSEEMVSIKELWKIVICISGKKLSMSHIPFPKDIIGVMGRNSNNDLIKKTLGWSPKVELKDGMKKLYEWIETKI